MSHEDVMRLLKEKAELTAKVEQLQGVISDASTPIIQLRAENERLRAEARSQIELLTHALDLATDQRDHFKAALEAIRDAIPQSYDWYQGRARQALEAFL
jgi:chromosome segregation ATPase